MSIQVHSSDNLADLSEALSGSLREEISRQDGLYSPTVIIPNKSMETWLNLDLVQRFGVVFNIRFLFLEKFLEELLLEKFSPEIDPKSRPFLQGESRKFQIYETLLRDQEFLQKYPILKNYLLPSGRKTPDPVRLLDLSGRLAKYFKDYELHRQDWIRNWLGDKYSLLRLPGEDIWEEVATQSEIFFFQKELYSYLTNSDPSKETLIQYSMRNFDFESKAKKHSPKNVYLFALSQLSSTYISIFQNLLPEIHLEVFQFGVPDGEPVTGTERNQICRNWANSFRSLKKSWEISGAEFLYSAKKEKQTKTVLSEFKEYLGRSEYKASSRLLPDESLQILEAPGKVREVEAIFHHILSILSESKETKLTDFGIFCSDLSEYRAALEFVFEGGIQAKLTEKSGSSIKTLPYSIRDVLASDTSAYISGILSLFTLLSKERSRADIFKLLRNPCFQSKWELEPSWVEEWAKFSEDLELYQDDSLAEDRPLAFSFRKGFLRLAAGNILSAEEEEDLPVSPFDSGSGPSVSAWIGIWKRVSSLLGEFSSLISDQKTSGEIILDSLSDLLRELFSSPSSNPIEVELEKNIIDSLYELKSVDWDPKSFKDRLKFLEAFFKQTGGEIQVRKGQYLTGGITVSSLQPMRPIPFRHVYILGLGEGLFPGTDDTSAFNLRHFAPREGDINVRGLNQSLLYETILSAKQSLILSFVAEDITKDESIAPSSSLLLLEQALKENILAPETSVRMKVPLNKHSKEYFIQKESASAKFAEKFRKSFDLSSSLLYGKEEDKEYYRKIVLGNFQNNPSAKKETPDLESIDWNDLVRFAKSPLSYHLQRRFGLYSEEISESENATEEPFRISDNFKFMKELWSYSMKKTEKELQNSLGGLFSIWEKRGNIPRGIFGDTEFITKSEKVGKISEAVSEILSDSEVLSGFTFGVSPKKGNLLSLPTIPFQILNGLKTAITGLKEDVFLKKEADDTLTLVLVYPNSKKKFKNLIEPFLIQSLLDLIPSENTPKSVTAIFGYGDKPTLLNMNREGGEIYRKKFLSDLVQEFYNRSISLVSPGIWEDFPDRTEIDLNDPEKLDLYSKEYKIWAQESVQYDPEIYLDEIIRLLPYSQNYISEKDFYLCLKLYHPLEKVFYAEK
ncbi:exodeoxyribonuclease V subunit gamma [Leptospira selangorensis]|uniref:Exodeoxyribonuclease V subunit gamma n=1 Tax=Leptospira selangorensis TaxID=2484982 RepID=A0A5F2C303_9LEPT|nr:exodeoxyribonuclease V subunit gamma [Leptospira selangorensis]TGM13498.1 exodeoxyribonuclease V subunit gamma [Leptospira selangorensis]TGM22161.1 exodeoxyribonuclease V subunit gamma [Leptospira selangorensis]